MPQEAKVTQDRATGRDVILAIAENMRQGLEPLVTKTLAPSLYQVYLHSEDYDRLRTIFGELEREAQKLLDEELERMNRGPSPVLGRLLKTFRKGNPGEGEPQPPPMRYVSAEGRWFIRFQEDPNGTLEPGDIEVVSEFAQPPSSSYGAGSKTRRISTTRRLGSTDMVTRQETVDSQGALARIAFTDKRGPQTYFMSKSEIVIGREAPDVWVDLRLDTLPDVSREHARLQRTPEGTFRLKDLSKLGTTVDGKPIPRSLETLAGEVKDLDRWVDLPDRARIGLAGVVVLDFERIDRP
jgi:FHA domain-containing protein